jgi:hypothetical protein
MCQSPAVVENPAGEEQAFLVEDVLRDDGVFVNQLCG